MKLGKKAVKVDHRTLKLASYIPATLPAVPASADWSPKVQSWGMMMNDSIGDCTCAAAGHLIMQWTANASSLVTPSDNEILAAYEAITGYNPSDPNSDNGAAELDVLNYWQNTGIAGHKIGAYVQIDPANHAHIQAAVYIFGGCYIGVQLPNSFQGASIWDVPAGGPVGDGEPGSWGGHAVEVVGYDASGVTAVTWGQLMKFTWAAWNIYCDEAYAILSQDFIEGNGETPDGFNLAALQADLKAVKS